MARTYRLFVLGRPTFDVEYARACSAAAIAALRESGIGLVGDGEILFDNASLAAEIEAQGEARADGVVVIQSTFTDAEAICMIAEHFDTPLHIWALPEPRTGGRLRLNAFCGLNLAAHALGLRSKPIVPLYLAADGAGIAYAVEDWLKTQPQPAPAMRPAEPALSREGERGLEALRGMRIGRIGEHPAGFDTCAYDTARLSALADVSVEQIALSHLFDQARAVDDGDVLQTREGLRDVAGLAEVDQAQLDRSLRLRNALDQLKRQGRFDAFAIRCWPETFTEYGGAVCGPVSMMGEKRTPCACEADVYGALSSYLLQTIADAPAFLADIVDMDATTDTTVLWHCGQAPASMASEAEPVSATIHSNRRMPLLFQFALKAGRVTLARISQAGGHQFMVIAGGEMQEAPPSFSGTSGVLKLDRRTAEVRDDLLAAGLEHHIALVYGDHRAALEHVAHELGLPVLDLTQ
ncbi:L-fucose/L-arabinose isomerase family protein [Nitratireductor basaltis]|uniref:L-fucose isomerase C-terminal domain-containing protein n=1 Tax=Nitratireductor basaltis TaxID=472175 RepID=A0A084UDV9_9HYPH|nr:hypothetical protein [Nitratireductor basaltis]KFB11145.1 hypothetical protein EL18_02190 [Nitratireductor basaltis]